MRTTSIVGGRVIVRDLVDASHHPLWMMRVGWRRMDHRRATVPSGVLLIVHSHRAEPIQEPTCPRTRLSSTPLLR
jgi:hypothetical protein